MNKNTRNACILFGVAGIAIAIALVLMGRKEDKETEASPENAYPEVAQAEKREISDSKYEAYTTHMKERPAIEDYWNDCTPGEDSPDEREKSPSGGVSAPRGASAEELLGIDEPAKASPAPRPQPSNPYRETAEEREARHQRRHEEALELAERMQEGQTTGHDSADVTIESDDNEEQFEAPQAEVRRSGAISSLDGWDDGGGLSSLDDDGTEVSDDPYTPFRCMFARESKVSDGQRVTVILLDDLMVSGIAVPKNTHLMATCQLSSRLELEFNNIEIGGRILSLGYEAYDIDGSKGIYCPDVSQTGKTVKNRGTDIIGSSLSGRLGRVAREVTSTGISLIQSSDGQRTVSVPAGYTFFIVKKRLN